MNSCLSRGKTRLTQIHEERMSETLRRMMEDLERKNEARFSDIKSELTAEYAEFCDCGVCGVRQLPQMVAAVGYAD